MTKYDPIKAAVLESIGCFALTFFGSFNGNMPEVSNKQDEQSNFLLENAIAHLFIYMVMMWLAAQHSGAQFNPLLSLAMAVTGELPAVIAAVNAFAQTAGAFLGFFAFKQLANTDASYLNYKDANRVNAVVFEFLPAFTLTLVFFMTTCFKSSDRGVYAVAVPAVYSVFTLSIGKLFYTRFNLLLLFVTAVMTTGIDKNMGLVALGAILGTALATVVYALIFKTKTKGNRHMPVVEDDHQIKF